MELAPKPEAPKILRPTFYLCEGVAGAGCTTAIESLINLGISGKIWEYLWFHADSD